MNAVKFALTTFLLVGWFIPTISDTKLDRTSTMQVGAISGVIVLVGALLINYFFGH